MWSVSERVCDVRERVCARERKRERESVCAREEEREKHGQREGRKREGDKKRLFACVKETVRYTCLYLYVYIHRRRERE